jgi:hypothetical protein
MGYHPPKKDPQYSTGDTRRANTLFRMAEEHGTRYVAALFARIMKERAERVSDAAESVLARQVAHVVDRCLRDGEESK